MLYVHIIAIVATLFSVEKKKRCLDTLDFSLDSSEKKELTTYRRDGQLSAARGRAWVADQRDSNSFRLSVFATVCHPSDVRTPSKNHCSKVTMT